jgi:hypothetical protein
MDIIKINVYGTDLFSVIDYPKTYYEINSVEVCCG